MFYLNLDYMETRSILKNLKNKVQENFKDLLASQNDKLADVVLELLNF
ncbi:MAG: hypothetical protein IJS47_00245 [Clostridia bacterium]|nr:hypothetical protein [Clostridia bacterium]